jgi:hypothetical protein
MRPCFALLMLFCVHPFCTCLLAQQAVVDTALHGVQPLPAQYLDKVAGQAQSVNQALTRKTTQYLNKFSRIEAKLLHKLHPADTSVASKLLPAQYASLAGQMQQPVTGAGSSGVNYVPSLDTLQTTLKFLQSQPGSMTGLSGSSVQLARASSQVQQLQANLNTSALVQQYITQRKQELSQLLSQYTHLPPGVTQAFTQFKATGYYYSQQVQQYKAMLNNPRQMEQAAVTILSKLPQYQQFLAKYSILASLFQLPAGYGSSAALQGLQTQTQIQSLVQQSGAASGGGMGAVQQQMQGAQTQITSIQNSLSKYGVGGQNLDMTNFQPNSQKTKTLLKRLEYGVNVQFAKSSYDFPSTGALGLTIGYKINDKSTIGVGASYNIGLGTGWNFIQFTNQGAGLRSFMDWKIKKTYYVTGGYELNYMSQFASIEQLQNRSAWEPSALIGLEKKYKISSKLTGNMQLLFDALYRQEIPQGQMIKFRVGYNF